MSGATVLVVDDDEFIRDLTSSALRIAGFATTMASGGLDALAAIERDHPDIVVLDVGLPGVDGFEVCRRLRAAGDQTPVMFLTARDAAEDRVSGFTSGGDDYLAKRSVSKSWSRGCGRSCDGVGRRRRRAVSATPTSRSTRTRSGSRGAASPCSCPRPSSRCCGSCC
jgi:CheY-like chemotaxis protein